MTTQKPLPTPAASELVSGRKRLLQEGGRSLTMRRDYGAHRVRRGEAGRTVRGLCTVIKKSRWWKTRENCQQPSRRLVTEGSACAQCPVPCARRRLLAASRLRGRLGRRPARSRVRSRDAAAPGLPSEPEANLLAFSVHMWEAWRGNTQCPGERGPSLGLRVQINTQCCRPEPGPGGSCPGALSSRWDPPRKAGPRGPQGSPSASPRTPPPGAAAAPGSR